MKKKLMAPGPVPIPPEILQQLSQPIIHHRTPEFEAHLLGALSGLKEVFQSGDQPVLMVPGTGSAAMEAAIVNTLSPGQEVLCLVNGKFGQRWKDMATQFDLKVHCLDFEWGEPVCSKTTADFLKNHPDVQAIFCQGVETSTGTINPIAEIGKSIKEINSDILFMVDGITAIGVSPISSQTPGVDVLVAGSQKAFMLPTGMSFICLSSLAWKKNKTAKLPKYYFDLHQEMLSNQKKQTRFSSLVTHIIGLHFVLKKYTGAFLCRRLMYTSDCAKAFQLAIQQMGLKLLSSSPAPSLTAIRVPENVDGLKLKSDISKTFGITLMGGQDHLKGQILRVGHMGYICKQDYCDTLTAIKEALKLQNYIIEPEVFDKTIKSFKENMGKDYDEYFSD